MTTRRRIQKAREERFVKNLEEARDALTGIIDDVEAGCYADDLANSLDEVSDRVNRSYSQAERMEARDER